jgi:hypothetical protein
MAKIKKAMKGGSKVAKPGKKGKSNETDEERLLRLEMERLAEEEARRAKEALRLQMFKDRMAQEEKYSRINRLKILNQWRKLMRLVKARGCSPRASHAPPLCQFSVGVAVGQAGGEGAGAVRQWVA